MRNYILILFAATLFSSCGSLNKKIGEKEKEAEETQRRKNIFIDMCVNPSSIDIKSTIDVFKSALPNSNCGEIFEEFNSFKSLTITRENIQSLEPFTLFPKLFGLGFISVPVKDYSPLTKLKNLIVLGIYSSSVSDFSSLGNLSKMENFTLAHSPVTDISFIRNYENLEYLSLYDTEVEDISSISDLTKLEYFEFWENPLGNKAKINDKNCPKDAKSEEIRKFCKG